MKKFISILLSLLMVISVITAGAVSVSAEEAENTPEVTELKITGLPDVTSYIAGNDQRIPDVIKGMEVELTFSDGTVKTVNADEDSEYFNSNFTVTGDNISFSYYHYEYRFYPAVGDNIIKVSCGDCNDEFTVTGKDLVNMEITRLPDRTEFIAGNSYYEYDAISGMELTMTYADGTSEVYSADRDADFFYNDIGIWGEWYTLPVGGRYDYFSPEEGENVLNVQTGHKTIQFSITGIEVTKLEITKEQDIKELTAGKKYDVNELLGGMEVAVTYADGRVENYAYDDTENGGRDFFEKEMYPYYAVIFIAKEGENPYKMICGNAFDNFSYTGVKLPGDVNGDGEYDILDAAAIQLYKAQLYTGEFDETFADINGDGEINILDAAYIQLDLAKL